MTDTVTEEAPVSEQAVEKALGYNPTSTPLDGFLTSLLSVATTYLATHGWITAHTGEQWASGGAFVLTVVITYFVQHPSKQSPILTFLALVRSQGQTANWNQAEHTALENLRPWLRNLVINFARSQGIPMILKGAIGHQVNTAVTAVEKELTA